MVRANKNAREKTATSTPERRDSLWFTRDTLSKALTRGGCAICNAVAGAERKSIYSFLHEGMMFPSLRARASVSRNTTACLKSRKSWGGARSMPGALFIAAGVNDRETREALVEARTSQAFRDLPPEQIEALVQSLNSLHEGELGVDMLVACGERAIGPLREFLMHGKPTGIFVPRQRAVRALAELGAKDVLIQYLDLNREISDPVAADGEEAVQNGAARALGTWRTDDVYEALQRILQRKYLTGAVEMLGEFRRPEAVPQLVAALEDDFCRSAAEDALHKLGEAPHSALIEAARPLNHPGIAKLLPVEAVAGRYYACWNRCTSSSKTGARLPRWSTTKIRRFQPERAQLLSPSRMIKTRKLPSSVSLRSCPCPIGCYRARSRAGWSRTSIWLCPPSTKKSRSVNKQIRRTRQVIVCSDRCSL
jgi:HEAT repeats